MRDEAFLDTSVRKIIELKKKTNREEFEPLLLPVFLDGLKGIMDDTDVPRVEWRGYSVGVMVDFDRVIRGVYISEFATNELLDRLGMTIDEALSVAMENLKHEPVTSFGLRFGTEPDDPVYLLPTDLNDYGYGLLRFDGITVIPALDCSMLMLDYLWKKIYTHLKGAFYILPVYRDYVYVVSQKKLDADQIDIIAFSRWLNEFEITATVDFSSRIFLYTGCELEKIV